MSLLPRNSPAVSVESPASGAEMSGKETPGPEFSAAERAQLLNLAHQSILSALEPGPQQRPEQPEIPLEPPTTHFAELRGVFTSLYLRRALRGCVGYPFPTTSLYRAVAETARAAAFEDNRFDPVTLDEASSLQIELSVLSPPRPIVADAVEVGRHGLLISASGLRGLLLPQVAVERGWNRITFLEQTCRKAGLPLDAWQKGATLEAFTAEVFGDTSC